jgi:hypothetical protein
MGGRSGCVGDRIRLGMNLQPQPSVADEWRWSYDLLTFLAVSAAHGL